IYDKHLSNLNKSFKDIYVKTRYGQTHVVNIGNQDSIPLVCLHGGNSNTPDMLISNIPMLENFNVFAIDTLGHPGKSDETRLSSNDLSYGFWLLDVIDALQLKTVNIYSGSFGAGIAIRLATVAPKKINKLSLFVPSGIAKGSKKDQLKLMIPYFRYKLRPTDQNLMKLCSTLMTRFDEQRVELLQAIFTHMNINPVMPRPAHTGELDNFLAPTLIMAAKNDILFPAARVIPRAKEIFPNLIYTEIIEGLHEPTEEIYEHIHRIANDFFTRRVVD
ncbi:MAG: alpha/beta hydrolase, partial [Candidatus Heimdallarchaeota archaeon]|nr:alpha/beta hydrolase [Candidatus Heimdallarchaeota archaeon]